MLSLDTPIAQAIAAAGQAGRAAHWDGPGAAWWPVFPILWFVLIAGLITVLALNGRRRARRAGSASGRSLLAERFASGQIDEEEYQSRLATLRRLER